MHRMLTRRGLRLVPPALLLLSAAGVAWGEGEEVAKGGAEWRAAYEATRAVVEELKAEVDAMRRIRAAQVEVMAWNEERARLGLSAMTLRPELCLEEENRRWCRLFPATFGVGEDGK